MAFTPSTLSVILQTIGGVGMRFVSYRSDDAIATVAGTDYFTGGESYGLRLHDLIFVSPVSGTVEPYILVVTEVDSEGNVTATQTAFDSLLTMLAGLTPAANKIPYFTGSDTAGLLDFKDEDDMASDSATAVPSQQSVKAYASNPANHYLTLAGTSTFSRTIKARYEDDNRYSILEWIDPAYHADIKAGTSTVDLTTQFHTAFASGKRLKVPTGTYQVTGLTGVAGLDMIGEDRANTIIKLKNASNATMLTFTDLSNVNIREMTFDGNKAGQTTTTSHRGIYVLANAAHCDNYYLSRLIIKNTGGQAVMFSRPGLTYRAGRWSVVEEVWAYNTGHTSFNGGTGVPGEATLWMNCYSELPAYQGFKTLGDHISCEVVGDDSDVANQGEGFETEYVSGAGGEVIRYEGCRVYKSNGGIRANGTNHTVIVRDFYAEELQYSAITAFGTLNEIRVDGLKAKNVGKASTALSGVRPSSDGFDVVSLLDPNSAVPTNVYLANITGEDTQGTKTGEYLVYIQSGFTDVVIEGGNDARTLKTGAFSFPTGADAGVRVRGYTKGWSAEYQSDATTTVGSVAADYDLKSTTIKRAEFRRGTKVDFETRAYPTGTNGTKELKFQINALTALSLATWTSGETDVVSVRGKIWAVTDTVVNVHIDMIVKGTTVATEKFQTNSISSGTDLAIKFVATMGGTDTMTQDHLKMRGIN